MPKRKNNVSVTPRDGGALMSRPSADRAGLANYVFKQDWRRDLDQEIRREGHDYFRPNLEAPLGNQPFPQNQPLHGQPVTVDFATDTITMTGVPRFNVKNGDLVRFTGGTLPAPLVAGVLYLVTSVTATSFRVSQVNAPAMSSVGPTDLVRGCVALANGVSSGTVSGMGLPFVPIIVKTWILRPSGALNLDAWANTDSFTADGFNFELDGTTDSGSYVLAYEVSGVGAMFTQSGLYGGLKTNLGSGISGGSGFVSGALAADTIQTWIMRPAGGLKLSAWATNPVGTYNYYLNGTTNNTGYFLVTEPGSTTMLPITAPGLIKRGTVALGNGISSGTVTTGFLTVPNIIRAWVRHGTVLLKAYPIPSSFSTTGFDFELNGTTDGGGYILQYEAFTTGQGESINLTSNGAGVLVHTVAPMLPVAPEAINLVHLARRPNGKTAVIVGTPTTLYRFQALEETAYFETFDDPAYFEGTGGEAYFDEGTATDPADDYFTGGTSSNSTYFMTSGEGAPYFEEETGSWQVIGSGFSKNGKRWEAVNINGYAVFNNGYDLPVTFRVEEAEVVPIYELRESGVAFVGTIAETNAVLMLGDIAQIKEEVLEENFAHTDSGDIQASQAGSLFSIPFTATAEEAQQGRAVHFDGVNDYISVPHSASLNLSGTAFTIEGWVKRPYQNTPENFYMLASKVTSGLTAGWQFGFESFYESGSSEQRFFLFVRTADGEALAKSQTQLPNGEYFHVAGVYDGTYLRLYLNGTEDGTEPQTGAMTTNSEAVAIGISAFPPSAPYLGDLAELRIWSTARTQAQIVAGMGLVSTPQAGLVGIWHFDEGSGTTAADSSGNGNTGTLINGPTWIESSSLTDAIVTISPLAAAAGGLTRAGATATFRTVTAHKFTTGQVVNISGAGGAEYNGDFTVTVTDFDKFTYTVGGAPTTPDPGTPQARRAFFEVGMVGKNIEFLNGLNGAILAYVNSTTLRVAVPAQSLIGYHYGFYIINPATDYQVMSSLNVFTPEMVGKNIFWDSGAERLIMSYVSGTEVVVDRHQTILLGLFQLENTGAYDAYTNAANYDRIQYRLLWSALEEPRRFSATVPGGMVAGSRQLQLDYPSRSFAIGQLVTITGAGVEGSNLEAEVIWIASNRRDITVDTAAATTVVDELVSASDAIGSIVGYDDLQDDSSGILKMLDLNGTLVVYKDTSIFMTAYTGLPVAPFKSRRIYNEAGEHSGRTPFYRHTLTSVNGEFHLYAGRNSFYRFDLGTQTPKEFALAENLSDLFYGQATAENTEKIYGGNNSLTKEVFIMFPSASAVKGICLDYFTNTASTTGADYTALATIKRPTEGIALGAVEDWCVCGDSKGQVLLYGKTDVPQALWAGGEAIYHRLGQGYESRLRSGLYGNRYHETDLTGYLLELSTQANPNQAEITVNVYGYRNAAESATLIDTITLPMAAFENLIPLFFREHYFQEELVISGQNNPCRIAARTWELGVVNSRSVIRRKG